MSISKPTVWDSGTPLAGYLWESENPKANLLLQHGLGEYAERFVWQYNRLIPKLVARGFNVYAIDLAGHGGSEGIRGLVDVNQAVSDHLRARSKISNNLPLVLFGHSLGGLVTAGSMVANPSGVAGIVMSSSAMQSPSKLWERLLSKAVTAINPAGDMPLPRPGEECLTRDQGLLELIRNDDRMYHGKARNLVAKTVLEVSDKVWKNLSVWSAPTLILHGDQDLSTNHKNSIALYKSLKIVDKSLKVYPGGYHELLNDLDRDLIEQDIFGFVDRLKNS